MNRSFTVARLNNSSTFVRSMTFWIVAAALFIGMPPAFADSEKKPVAGKADVLRRVPKKFATLISADADDRSVELKLEGEEETKTWKLEPDAELKVHGWWGRLGQLQAGDRVWAWFAIDRKRQPRSILMLADELSEQVIHGSPHRVAAFDAEKSMVTVESKTGGERRLKVDGMDLSGQLGKQAFVQTAGETARTVASGEQMEALQSQQKEWLRDRWRNEGLPGVVTFLHPLSGEMEIMLDHEAMRWGRHLRNGDKVSLNTKNSITAHVKHVHPWRERTLVRLVTASGADQFDLSLGERIQAQLPEPPAEIQQAELPADIGRRASKRERVEWFLASVYCPCKISGDRCTGMFYTLASCNENSCGMPNQVRKQIGEMIDKGMTDVQIWKELQKQRGPQAAKQHLLH